MAGPDQGDIPGDQWLTRPLWGLADSAPYLHDGRAATVHQAILAHGGAALEAQSGYVAASEPDRAALRVFLMSLGRAPKLVTP